MELKGFDFGIPALFIAISSTLVGGAFLIAALLVFGLVQPTCYILNQITVLRYSWVLAFYLSSLP